MTTDPAPKPQNDRSPWRRWWRNWTWNRARLCHKVEVDRAALALPQSCSNCGQVASKAHAEDVQGRALLIPYCASCSRCLDELSTRRLAAALSSCLLAVTSLLALPTLRVQISLVALLLGVALAAALPLGIVSFLVKRPASNQAASARAVFARGNSLLCFNPSWANELAEKQAKAHTQERVREPVLRLWMWGAVLLAVAVAPSVYAFVRPSLVVLNFGDAEVSLVADSEPLVRVTPSSLESPHAAVRVRLPAGAHDVSVVAADGSVLQTHSVRLAAGQPHLMVVGGEGYCFWLEYDTYGKAPAAPRRYRALDPGQGFWVLPGPVDSWFAENPPPSGDTRSSGGTRAALRHARCEQAPPGRL